MIVRNVGRRAACVAAVSALLSAIASCILADAPPEQPRSPTRRPVIVHASVSPPASKLLGELSLPFVVPVLLGDPRVPFEWRLFIDYDPILNPDGALVQRQFGGGSPTAADLQIVTFSVDETTLNSACHRIEFLVALNFTSTHGADASGADSIAWFYSPSGSLEGCTTYDGGGNDGAFPPTKDGQGPDAPADTAAE